MTTIPTDITDFLEDAAPFDGEKHTPYKFTNIGDTLKGVIAEKPRVVEVPTFDNSGREKKMVVAVRDDAGATWALWVKARSNMATAISEACKAKGTSGIAEGGTLAVRFQETKDTGKGNPLKVFRAAYDPPSTVTSVDELL